MEMTITEALAEIKTIEKRVEKKGQFVSQFLFRQDVYKDPLENEGGSRSTIERERQAINDLHQRLVNIRLAIQTANADNTITVEGKTKSIAEWIVWRREIAPEMQKMLTSFNAAIQGAHKKARELNIEVVKGDAAKQPNDVHINVDEAKLAAEIEDMEMVLGTLDGQLSLKNATITVQVKD